MLWVKKNAVIIQLLGGIIATLVTLTAYSFTTFQTRAEHDVSIGGVNHRLDRIEDKIDRIYDKLTK